MTEFKRHLREYAERELELIGFMETEFGESCLKFLEDLAEISKDDKNTMHKIINFIPLLIEMRPISPITEKDFEVEIVKKGTRTIALEKCKRYPFVYKKDGKYWDDRAVAFQNKSSNTAERIYTSASKQEVQLPYMPQDHVIKV